MNVNNNNNARLLINNNQQQQQQQQQQHARNGVAAPDAPITNAATAADGSLPTTPQAVAHNMQWTNLSLAGAMSGRIPTARCNHGVCSIGKWVFCIGGRGEGEELRYNDTHILDTETMEWQSLVETCGDAPVPSSSFSLSVVRGVIYMFGGKHRDGYMNGLYSIHHRVEHLPTEGENSATGSPRLRHIVEWTKPTTLGEAPAPRYLHSAAVIADRIFIYGGCTFDEVCLSDLHIFNTRDMTWARQTSRLTRGAPSPRARHAAGVSANKMYVFGGLDKENNIFDDVYSFDADELTWCKEQTIGRKPPATYGHSMNSFGSRLVVFGGVSDTDGESTNDSWVLNTQALEWSAVRYSASTVASDAVGESHVPEFRNGHRTASVSGNQILVVAGWHRRYLGDVLRLNTGIQDTHKEHKPSLFAPHIDIAKRSRACLRDITMLYTTPRSTTTTATTATQQQQQESSCSRSLLSSACGGDRELKRAKLTIDVDMSLDD